MSGIRFSNRDVNLDQYNGEYNNDAQYHGECTLKYIYIHASGRKNVKLTLEHFFADQKKQAITFDQVMPTYLLNINPTQRSAV